MKAFNLKQIQDRNALLNYLDLSFSALVSSDIFTEMNSTQRSEMNESRKFMEGIVDDSSNISSQKKPLDSWIWSGYSYCSWMDLYLEYIFAPKRITSGVILTGINLSLLMSCHV